MVEDQDLLDQEFFIFIRAERTREMNTAYSASDKRCEKKHKSGEDDVPPDLASWTRIELPDTAAAYVRLMNDDSMQVRNS